MKTPKVNFRLKGVGKKNSEKPAQIIVNFSYNSIRTRPSTGLSIKPSNWDKQKSLPKTSFADYADYKRRLFEIEEKIIAHYKKSIEKGIIPDPQSFHELLKGTTNLIHESEVVDFFERFDEFVEERKLYLDPKTVKKDSTLLKLLKQFAEDKKCKVLFETINASFETRFKHYLNFEHEQNNTTVGKYIDCLKGFLKWAYKRGYHSNIAYQEFKSEKEPTKVIALEDAEVERLKNLDLESEPHLARIRDKFLFQLHTAQRFEDIRTVKWSHIKFNDNGNIYWHLFQSKASKTDETKILIIGEAKRILELQEKGAPETSVFPNVENQPFNKYLKVICKLAKIDDYTVKVFNRGNQRIEIAGPKYQFISSHTARRSYCTLSSEKGMTDIAIRGVTGHKDPRMLNRYLAKNQKHIDAEVNKYWANC